MLSMFSSIKAGDSNGPYRTGLAGNHTDLVVVSVSLVCSFDTGHCPLGSTFQREGTMLILLTIVYAI